MTNPEFILTRSFDAPIEKVWQAWTDEAQLKQWFGPKGCPIFISSMNFCVGGAYHYGMKLPVGLNMWGRWIFKEIAYPSRLVWDHHFSDESGTSITRHPFAPTWPLEMVTTITLQDDGGKTKQTLNLIAINTTDIERQTFEAGTDGMNQGWGATFDQLANFLAA
jgi:uncharacterized protein YndB with AHSA1/START domain